MCKATPRLCHSLVFIQFIFFVILLWGVFTGCSSKGTGSAKGIESILGVFQEEETAGTLSDGTGKRGKEEQSPVSYSGNTDSRYDLMIGLGDALAKEALMRYGMPVKKKGLQKYVNLVGRAVSLTLPEDEIPFVFAVLDNPGFTSFSTPSGIVFVSSGFFRILHDEAELAAVLARELALIRQKAVIRAISGIRPPASENADEDPLEPLISHVFHKGISPEMHLAADKKAVHMLFRAGYDPHAVLRVVKAFGLLSPGMREKGRWEKFLPSPELRAKVIQDSLSGLPDTSKAFPGKERFTRHMP